MALAKNGREWFDTIQSVMWYEPVPQVAGALPLHGYMVSGGSYTGDFG